LGECKSGEAERFLTMLELKPVVSAETEVKVAGAGEKRKMRSK